MYNGSFTEEIPRTSDTLVPGSRPVRSLSLKRIHSFHSLFSDELSTPKGKEKTSEVVET